MFREIIFIAGIILIVLGCYLVDFYYRHGHIWKCFINDFYVFDTGSGLFRFAIIKVHVGRGHCRLTLERRYTYKTEKVWIIPSHHSIVKIICSKCKSYTLNISEGEDFTVEVITFSKEK